MYVYVDTEEKCIYILPAMFCVGVWDSRDHDRLPIKNLSVLGRILLKWDINALLSRCSLSHSDLHWENSIQLVNLFT